MDHCKCSSLFNASKALLKQSGLISWDGEKFVANHPANDDSEFEKYWKTNFDLDYGRYICWVMFSVGAENLAKAACICNGIVKIVTEPPKLPYPIYRDSLSPIEWADKVLNDSWDQDDPPQPEIHHYGTLEKYWKSTKNHKAYLECLCERGQVGANDCKLLTAAFKYVTQAIRNRDAHTYIFDQRRKNYPGVKPIFVPSFNVLVRTMKTNGHFGG